MTDIDKQVLAFLKEWLAWAEAGGPEHKWFRKEYGLCANAKGPHVWDWVKVAIAGETYPFGWADYNRRAETGTQHECPKRLAWVRAKIAELETKGDE